MDYKNGKFLFNVETYSPIIEIAQLDIQYCNELLHKYKGTIYIRKNINSDIQAMDIDSYLEVRDLNGLFNYNKATKLSPLTQSDYLITPHLIDSIYELRPDPTNLKMLSTNNLYIELSTFIDWLGAMQGLDYLSNQFLITRFLEQAVLGISQEVIENKYDFKLLKHQIYKYFDQSGYLIFMYLLGQQVKFDVHNIEDLALDEETLNEEMLDGKYWFDLDSITERWEIHNISRRNILHFAETARLEICFDWVSSRIRDYWFAFKKNPKFNSSVSPLVSLIRLPVDSIHFHIYEVDDDSVSRYNRLVALSDEDVKDFISRGEIRYPTCGVNGFELEYLSSRDFKENSFYPNELDPVVLEENHLLITSREVKRFENDVLKLNTSKENKISLVNSKNDKPLSPTIENSQLRVMGALLELLKNRRTQPYTLELIKSELTEKYGEELGIIGFSKSNLDKLFGSANKALKDK